MLSRLLSTLMVAIAVAVAPLAMPIDSAMAAAPAHHGDMAKSGHCSGEPQQEPSDEGKKPCCVAGCFALATLDAPAAEAADFNAAPERPVQQRFRRGVLGEIATPPPRSA